MDAWVPGLSPGTCSPQCSPSASLLIPRAATWCSSANTRCFHHTLQMQNGQMGEGGRKQLPLPNEIFLHCILEKAPSSTQQFAGTSRHLRVARCLQGCCIKQQKIFGQEKSQHKLTFSSHVLGCSSHSAIWHPHFPQNKNAFGKKPADTSQCSPHRVAGSSSPWRLWSLLIFSFAGSSDLIPARCHRRQPPPY